MRDIALVPPATWEGLLIDIDGVLHVGAEPVEGALEAVELIRRRGLPFRLVTNTTSRSRRLVVERLNGMGFELEDDDVLTPASLAVQVCRDRSFERVALHVAPPLAEDLAELGNAGDDDHPQAVVVGDLGRDFTWDRLNEIFIQLHNGAQLIALQRNRLWESQDGLVLDAGPFVVALEYAAQQEALVTGKPSRAFFAQALAQLGVKARDAAMIGDDVEADVGGAIEAGLCGVLVRTGKFRPQTLESSGVHPTQVWDSIAELADHL